MFSRPPALFFVASLLALQGIPRLNTVFLTGYLGQDPKPKYFDSGKVVLNLSLAVKREYHPIEVCITVDRPQRLKELPVAAASKV